MFLVSFHIELCLLVLAAEYVVLSVPGEPCLSYTLVNDGRRSTQNILNSPPDLPICDYGITEADWVRFSSNTGTTIPERQQPGFVQTFRCGTEAPIFIRGLNVHPVSANVTTPLQVCANADNTGNCRWQSTIYVIKCVPASPDISFFVYKLVSPPGCDYAYCAGENAPCPPGTMWNGFQCVANNPVMSGLPTFSGPVILSTSTDSSGYTFQRIGFTCTVRYTSTANDTNARFKVRFLFDGREMATIPNNTYKYAELLPTVRDKHLLRVDLDEDHLRGRLGKYISCVVQSYWLTDDTLLSNPMESAPIWAGIESTPAEVVLRQSNNLRGIAYFSSTLPITCYHRFNISSNACSYTFRVPKTSLSAKTQCSVWWNQTGMGTLTVQVPQQIYVTSSQTATVTFDPYSEIRPTLWDGYILPAVKIRIEDAPVASCRTYVDPHIQTFDSRRAYRWSAQVVGDFYLAYVSRSNMHLNVQVRHKTCATYGTCNCGIIVREGNSAIGINYCNGPLRITKYLEQYPNDGSKITRNSDGTQFTIAMPSGVRADITVYFSDGSTRTAFWYMNIYLYMPQYYKAAVNGLCGNYNDELGDDPSIENHAEQFRIPMNTSMFSTPPQCHALQNPEALKCNCSNNSTSVLDCPSQGYDPLLATYAVNAQSTDVTCRSITTAVNTLSQNAHVVLRARSSVYRSDNYIANDELYSPPEVPISARTRLAPSWPTASNKTEQQVEQRCRSLLTGSSMYAECSSRTDFENLVSSCKTDVQLSDNYAFADGYTDHMAKECVSSEIMQMNSTENAGPSEVLTDLMNKYCLDHCSEHGTCRNDTCVCQQDYVGLDCRFHKDTVPTLTDISRNALCDVRHRPCETIGVNVNNIIDSTKLTCRFIRQTSGSQVADVSYTTASMVSSVEATCPLPSSAPHSSKQTTPTEVAELRYSVSIANNAANFSEELTIVVYDSNCMNCGDNFQCTQKANTCLISNRCYADGAANPDGSCQQCAASKNATSWNTAFEWSDWIGCSRQCDTGYNKRSLRCRIDNSLTDEYNFCQTKPCAAVPTEVHHGTVLAFAKVDVINVLVNDRALFDEVARAVNSYCALHRLECCRAAGSTGTLSSSANDMTTPALCTYGSGYPVNTTLDTRIKVIVNVTREAVLSNCQSSGVPETPFIYLHPSTVYSAVSASKSAIEQRLGIPVLDIEQVTAATTITTPITAPTLSTTTTTTVKTTTTTSNPTPTTKQTIPPTSSTTTTAKTTSTATNATTTTTRSYTSTASPAGSHVATRLIVAIVISWVMNVVS